MKITLWIECDGTVYIATPTTDIENKRRIRIGHIENTGSTYSVAFQVPCLQAFDKSGFATRNEAVSYEQEIINMHLTMHLRELFQKGENN